MKAQDRLPSAHIAREWLEAWSDAKTSAGGPGVGGSVLDWDLPCEQPERAWLAILEILSEIKADTNNRRLGLLAAGPLEDLMCEHGAKFIERVELEARRNPEFALLLGGVWRGEINSDVWDRMGKFAKRGW